MKSRISYSHFSTILTIVIFVVLYIGCMVNLKDEPAFFIILAMYVILAICALLFGAAYIAASPDYIVLGSLLHKKRLLMRNVESVERFQPTMGAIRVFGSGGFMGYWGIFREGDIGRYSAFYGKSSDCFLVRMKNGDKYVLGCKDVDLMIDYIQSHINARR